MGRINRLDKSVYNRISAGEVVENPASVVKELVENAIDAGATEIIVSVEYGGIKRISVIDNGCGMEEDDLELAVFPHATSKIACAEDLETVSTLGFRGEALASICAVSKTVIRSRYAQSEDPSAAYISVEGGEIVEKGKCNLQKGTTIEVNSLFYNTPARFRFLKTPKGEEGLVTRLIGELILANPDISITYITDGTTVFLSGGEGLESAVCTVFGADIHSVMVGFYISEHGYTINGFTSRAASIGIKSNRNNEIFIVNGRCISDQTMQAVVANAYGERLMRRTYPTIVIDIVMPFADVDVNVHPNKKEVRFADTKLLYGLIYNAIKKGLEEDEKYQKETLSIIFTRGQLPEESMPKREEEKEEPQEEKQEIDEFSEVRDELKKIFYDNFPDADKYVDPPEPEVPHKTFNAIKPAEEGDHPYEDPSQFFDWTNEPGFKKGMVFPQFLDFSDSVKDTVVSYEVIGQLFDTYFLVEVGEKMIIIDQHAAHERMIFDKLVEQMKKNVSVQELLVPFEIELDHDKAAFIFSREDDFKNVGFDLDFRDDVVIVKSVPAVLVHMDIKAFFDDLDDGSGVECIAEESIFRERLAQKACKSAIKGGDKLNKDQIDYFIDEYVRSNTPIQCPHGRPIVITITKREIEKMFGRIV